MMNKRACWLFLLVGVVTFLTASVVMAGTNRSPSKDIWCLATEGAECFNEAGLSTVSSSLAGGCAPSRIGFVGWDLTDVSQEIGSAELTLTTFNVSLAPAPPATLEFTLFEPSTQDWTEALEQTSPGSAGATLATTAAALSDGTTPQTVVFGGSANPADAAALGAYFDSLKGSGSATVGIRISGGCLTNTGVFFNDREDSGNLPGGAEATEPDLIFLTPTAVSLGSISAVGQVQNGAGVALFIAALLLLGTGTAVYYRRRQNDMP